MRVYTIILLDARTGITAPSLLVRETSDTRAMDYAIAAISASGLDYLRVHAMTSRPA
jgi:hypothetical protein